MKNNRHLRSSSIFTYIILLLLSVPKDVRAQFEERSDLVGVNHEYRQLVLVGGGVAIADFNNDNLPDLFFAGGALPDQFYINNGSGFDRKISYLAPEDFDFFNYPVTSVAAGDVNNDGWEDVLLCTERSHDNVLLMNNGNNTFDAIPPDSSGISGKFWSLGASFGDINEDGLLDIFIRNYTEIGQISIDTTDGTSIFEHIGYTNKIYMNQGDAVFEDVSDEYGQVIRGNTLSSAFTDYDNDGDVDLYVINDFGEDTEPNELYRNELPVDAFTDVSEPSGADVGLFGMGVAVGDYDADLDLDYYVTNLGRNALLKNNGNGGFDDAAAEAGVRDSAHAEGLAVGWGTGFMDYDNDGDLDLYIANGYISSAEELINPVYNPSKLYSNNGDGTFNDLSDELNFGGPSIFRGSAFGDLDLDGDLDVVMVPVTCCPTPVDPGLEVEAGIFYNVTENNNNWISFRLEGVESNRNGYGARLTLYDNSGRVQIRECDGGSTHASFNSSYIHFGIGSAERVDSLVIHWPNGLIQKITEPVINNLSIVVEGEGATPVLTAVIDNNLPEVTLFPNPAADVLTIQLETFEKYSTGLYLSAFDSSGRLVLQERIYGVAFTLDISTLAAGVYWLRIDNGKNAIAQGQFVKMREGE